MDLFKTSQGDKMTMSTVALDSVANYNYLLAPLILIGLIIFLTGFIMMVCDKKRYKEKK